MIISSTIIKEKKTIDVVFNNSILKTSIWVYEATKCVYPIKEYPLKPFL